MNITTWLEAVKGRAALMAAHFGKTPAAISQWKTNGVPLDMMRAVCAFSGGELTLEELVPEDPARTAGHPLLDAAATAQA